MEHLISHTKTSLINQSYTSYMLDEAHKGGVLEILVAVLSCAWSYQMLGEHHKTIPGALEHPMYGEWVNGYSCQEYCKSTQLISDLVNKYGEGITKEREAHLKELFVNSFYQIQKKTVLLHRADPCTAFEWSCVSFLREAGPAF